MTDHLDLDLPPITVGEHWDRIATYVDARRALVHELIDLGHEPAAAAALVAQIDALAAGTARPPPVPEAPAAHPPLTEREADVLQLIARHKTNRQIGAALFISENTVKNHVRHILEKHGVSSRAAAVMQGLREGTISLDE